MTFDAGSGHELTAGSTYVDPNESRLTDFTAPAISYSGYSTDGSGCGPYEEVGEFTVRDIAFDADRVTRFAVTFTYRCHADGPKMVGSIAWRAQDKAVSPPGFAQVPTGPPTSLTATPAGTSVTLAWLHPDAPDWQECVVREAIGAVPPAKPTDGEAVYTGPIGQVLVSGLKPATTYSFAVFARDTEGLLSPGATVVVVGDRLVVTVPAGGAKFQAYVTVGGQLLDVTGKPLTGRQISLQRKPSGATTYSSAGTASTGPDGRFSVVVRVATNTEYRATYAGGPGEPPALGSVSPSTVGLVAPTLVATPDKTKAKKGTTFAIRVTCAPQSSTGTIALQEYVNHKWRTVSTKKQARAGSTFKVKPTKGSHQYRAYRPADSTLVAGAGAPFTIKVT
jgi:hypothetical protein